MSFRLDENKRMSDPSFIESDLNIVGTDFKLAIHIVDYEGGLTQYNITEKECRELHILVRDSWYISGGIRLNDILDDGVNMWRVKERSFYPKKKIVYISLYCATNIL